MNRIVSDTGYRMEPFDHQHLPAAADLAGLHTTLLPHSPVALLGPRFMEHFYYRILPQMGAVFGAVAYVAGEPAGFIVSTDDSAGFMGKAIRRHWLRLSRTLAHSLMEDWRRAGAIWEAWQIMRGLPQPSPGDAAGEMLSLGVLPQFRKPAFIRRTGLNIGTDLLDSALEQLKRRDVGTVRVVVDEDNTAAKLFYRGLGWTLTKSSVPGWRVPVVEFEWRLDKT